MDGGSNQWPAIDGTSNHGWDRPKPLTGPPTSGSQNVVNEATIREDIQYQVNTGFSQIFTWKEVHRLQPKQLKCRQWR
jgi:hypothetical protein